MSAADIAARQAAGAAGDRAYQNQLLDPRNRFRGTHPMMRQVCITCCRLFFFIELLFLKFEEFLSFSLYRLRA
jgi:hypothetical protein